MTLYGALLRCYPRDFRREYGDDMAQLLALQLRDENAARVWVRTFVDLALTVPSLRLEAVMSRRKHKQIPTLPKPAAPGASAAGPDRPDGYRHSLPIRNRSAAGIDLG